MSARPENTRPRRLSRVHRVLGPATWYLESDHILLADQSGFVVYYRRFYYSDLRAVAVWPRARRGWRFAGAPALAALAGLIGFGIPAALARNAWVVCVPMAVFALLMLAYQGVAGPFAGTRITTLYSTCATSLVPRWRIADRILERLQPYLAAAQAPIAGGAATTPHGASAGADPGAGAEAFAPDLVSPAGSGDVAGGASSSGGRAKNGAPPEAASSGAA